MSSDRYYEETSATLIKAAEQAYREAPPARNTGVSRFARRLRDGQTTTTAAPPGPQNVVPRAA